MGHARVRGNGMAKRITKNASLLAANSRRQWNISSASTPHRLWVSEYACTTGATMSSNFLCLVSLCGLCRLDPLRVLVARGEGSYDQAVILVVWSLAVFLNLMLQPADLAQGIIPRQSTSRSAECARKMNFPVAIV